MVMRNTIAQMKSVLVQHFHVLKDVWAPDLCSLDTWVSAHSGLSEAFSTAVQARRQCGYWTAAASIPGARGYTRVKATPSCP